MDCLYIINCRMDHVDSLLAGKVLTSRYSISSTRLLEFFSLSVILCERLDSRARASTTCFFSMLDLGSLSTATWIPKRTRGIDCADVSKMAVKVESLCSIWATVPTGLEKGAADECKELLGRGDVLSERGKVSFPLYSLNELSKVMKFASPISEVMLCVHHPVTHRLIS